MAHTRLLGAIAALALLGACSSDGDKNAAATGSGGAGTVGSSGPRPGSQEDLAASVGDRVYFETDRSTVGPDQRPVLERQAGWFARNASVTAQIEGHADERGTREYNLALGQRRANSARDILVVNGVSSARLSTISYGKDRPAALGSDESAWAQNRRAVTTVR